MYARAYLSLYSVCWAYLSLFSYYCAETLYTYKERIYNERYTESNKYSEWNASESSLFL